MSLVPPHQACHRYHCNQQGCDRNRSPKQGLTLNRLIKLFPPRLQKAALLALIEGQPASTGTFQLEAEAAWNLHSRTAAGASKGEHRHRQQLAPIHQV